MLWQYTVDAGGRAPEVVGGLDPKPESGPAPGEYELPTAWRTGPAMTFAGGRPPPRPEPDPAPGPGHYHVPPRPGEGLPAYTFGARALEALPEEVPGPGAYHMSPPAAAGPAFSMPGRPASPGPEPLPGPGAYDPPGAGAGPAPPTGPAYTFGGRPPQRPSPGPGPGAYLDRDGEAEGLAGPAYSMGTRPAEREAPDSPGPGAYRPADPALPNVSGAGRSVATAGGAAGVTCSISSRQPHPTASSSAHSSREEAGSGAGKGAEEECCGPAAVLPDPRGLRKGVPLQGGRRLEAGVRGAAAAGVHACTRQAGTRRSRRSQLPPEPGQYWSPPPPAGPAYSMGAKGAGPTPYKPEVGPGDYDDPRDLHTGPAWTLRPRPTPPPPDPIPGPGEYDDAKPFPNPLGTVISRPRASAERDPATATDFGDPYGPTMDARTFGRTGRKVSFTTDTRFRALLRGWGAGDRRGRGRRGQLRPFSHGVRSLGRQHGDPRQLARRKTRQKTRAVFLRQRAQRRRRGPDRGRSPAAGPLRRGGGPRRRRVVAGPDAAAAAAARAGVIDGATVAAAIVAGPSRFNPAGGRPAAVAAAAVPSGAHGCALRQQRSAPAGSKPPAGPAAPPPGAAAAAAAVASSSAQQAQQQLLAAALLQRGLGGAAAPRAEHLEACRLPQGYALAVQGGPLSFYMLPAAPHAQTRDRNVPSELGSEWPAYQAAQPRHEPDFRFFFNKNSGRDQETQSFQEQTLT
ncbi:Outer dense fiber protein 3-like protein 2, partial [Tetrabaena socialis]